MSDTDPSPAASAQATADAAWADHDTARAPMRDALLATLTSLEGVTGLQAGPGSERLADAFLDFAEYHADELAAAHTARESALAAQDARDRAIAAEPVAAPEVTPSMLETEEPLVIREWLKSANDVDILKVLQNVPTRDEQVEWANRLMGWARTDGNVATTFTAINSILVPSNPSDVPAGGMSGGTGASSTYRGQEQIPAEASADDEPTGREDASEQVPTGDLDTLVAWINHGADDTFDADRARKAFVTEQGRAGGARPDVMVKLVELLDVKPPAEPEAEPEGPLPLYEFVAPEGTPFDATEWPVAAVQTTDGKALYTHPSTDVAGGPAMQLPDDSMWKVHEGDTQPA